LVLRCATGYPHKLHRLIAAFKSSERRYERLQLADCVEKVGFPNSLYWVSFRSAATTRKAIKLVVAIFDECFRAGQLKVAMSHENGCLYGYALLFVHPAPQLALFATCRSKNLRRVCAMHPISVMPFLKPAL